LSPLIGFCRTKLAPIPKASCVVVSLAIQDGESTKFDAVIVDLLSGGLALRPRAQEHSQHKNSVAFAILNGKRTTTQEAFGMGANFVLQKPISGLNASLDVFTPRSTSC